MAKKVVGYIKLQVKAGQANPSPPVGPALGQRGLNIMEFCKAFNAATQKVEPGLPIPVIITCYSDRSFTFIMKTPPASILLKKAAGIESGSKRPNTEKVGKPDTGPLHLLPDIHMPCFACWVSSSAELSPPKPGLGLGLGNGGGGGLGGGGGGGGLGGGKHKAGGL